VRSIVGTGAFFQLNNQPSQPRSAYFSRLVFFGALFSMHTPDSLNLSRNSVHHVFVNPSFFSNVYTDLIDSVSEIGSFQYVYFIDRSAIFSYFVYFARSKKCLFYYFVVAAFYLGQLPNRSLLQIGLFKIKREANIIFGWAIKYNNKLISQLIFRLLETIT
jgi:hypothetical protein